MQTAFESVPNWTGVLHVRPPSVDLDAYSAVPLLPWMPLSKVRYAVPFWSVTIRWSWLLRTLLAVICTGALNVLPLSCDTDTKTGEWVLPSNCAQVT